LVTISDIQAARARISGAVHRTPLLHSKTLSGMSGFDVYLKAENLQKAGAFKARGASNKVFGLSERERSSGVVAASSGNHGQAVAYAAARVGARAIIVMPVDAQRAKVEAAKCYGAEVVFCGTTATERLERAEEISRETGMTLVHPYDDPDVIAGQGTAALEIIEDLPDVDAVVAPIGGGGLISGTAVAVKESRPGVKVIGVEPAKSNCMGVSIDRGERTRITTSTVADGLRSNEPGVLPFAIVRKYVDSLVLVSEEEIVDAMLLIMERMKLLVEPSGAVSVAAVLAGRLPSGVRRVAAIISGGNVDLQRVAELIVSRRA